MLETRHTDKPVYGLYGDDKHGRIVAQKLKDFRGGVEQFRYEWVGAPVLEISQNFLWDALPSEVEVFQSKNSGYILQPGVKIRIGPFMVKVTDSDLMMVTAVRMGGFLWWFPYLWHRATPLVDKFYRRSIITLAVWGLARYSPQTIPYWRDVHILRQIAEVVARAKQRWTTLWTRGMDN
jgi:hypothetical protein